MMATCERSNKFWARQQGAAIIQAVIAIGFLSSCAGSSPLKDTIQSLSGEVAHITVDGKSYDIKGEAECLAGQFADGQKGGRVTAGEVPKQSQTFEEAVLNNNAIMIEWYGDPPNGTGNATIALNKERISLISGGTENPWTSISKTDKSVTVTGIGLSSGVNKSQYEVRVTCNDGFAPLGTP